MCIKHRTLEQNTKQRYRYRHKKFWFILFIETVLIENVNVGWLAINFEIMQGEIFYQFIFFEKIIHNMNFAMSKK